MNFLMLSTTEVLILYFWDPNLLITLLTDALPDSKVHGANMGPIWVLSAPDGPHVGPMNLSIWAITCTRSLINTVLIRVQLFISCSLASNKCIYFLLIRWHQPNGHLNDVIWLAKFIAISGYQMTSFNMADEGTLRVKWPPCSITI